MEKRRRLEKVSLPGPSAGRGAFLMVGYCWTDVSNGQCHQLGPVELGVLGGVVYRSCPDTTIFHLLNGSLSLGSFDELELRLASVRTLELRHGEQLSSRPESQATLGRFTVWSGNRMFDRTAKRRKWRDETRRQRWGMQELGLPGASKPESRPSIGQFSP